MLFSGLEAEGDRTALARHLPQPQALRVPHVEEGPRPADSSSPCTRFLPPLGLARIQFFLAFSLSLGSRTPLRR